MILHKKDVIHHTLVHNSQYVRCITQRWAWFSACIVQPSLEGNIIEALSIIKYLERLQVNLT